MDLFTGQDTELLTWGVGFVVIIKNKLNMKNSMSDQLEVTEQLARILSPSASLRWFQFLHWVIQEFPPISGAFTSL